MLSLSCLYVLVSLDKHFTILANAPKQKNDRGATAERRLLVNQIRALKLDRENGLSN